MQNIENISAVVIVLDAPPWHEREIAEKRDMLDISLWSWAAVERRNLVVADENLYGLAVALRPACTANPF